MRLVIFPSYPMNRLSFNSLSKEQRLLFQEIPKKPELPKGSVEKPKSVREALDILQNDMRKPLTSERAQMLCDLYASELGLPKGVKWELEKKELRQNAWPVEQYRIRLNGSDVGLLTAHEGIVVDERDENYTALYREERGGKFLEAVHFTPQGFIKALQSLEEDIRDVAEEGSVDTRRRDRRDRDRGRDRR